MVDWRCGLLRCVDFAKDLFSSPKAATWSKVGAASAQKRGVAIRKIESQICMLRQGVRGRVLVAPSAVVAGTSSACWRVLDPSRGTVGFGMKSTSGPGVGQWEGASWSTCIFATSVIIMREPYAGQRPKNFRKSRNAMNILPNQRGRPARWRSGTCPRSARPNARRLKGQKGARGGSTRGLLGACFCAQQRKTPFQSAGPRAPRAQAPSRASALARPSPPPPAAPAAPPPRRPRRPPARAPPTMPDHGQVQLRLPLEPPPSSCDPRCGSPAAHISLRRFAQEYVFGSCARLGPGSAPAPPPPTPTTAAPPSPPHTFAAPAAAADFASCAARPGSRSSPPSPARRQRAALAEAPTQPVLSAEPAASPSSRGPALPVRTRAIERKPVPKRGRDTVTVDALAAIFDDVLGGADTSSWRKRQPTKKLRETRRPRTGPAAAFGVPVQFPSEAAPPASPRAENKGEPQESISSLENEDTAAELSFLVEKCDLDAEKRQSMFMPYIT